MYQRDLKQAAAKYFGVSIDAMDLPYEAWSLLRDHYIARMVAEPPPQKSPYKNTSVYIANDDEQYRDADIYVRVKGVPGEYRFRVTLDKRTGHIDENNEVYYSPNDEASFDEFNGIVPPDVRVMYMNMRNEAYAKLKGESK